MASLDLLQVNRLLDAAGAAVVALATLGLFLLTFEFLATTKRLQRSRGNCSVKTAKRRVLEQGKRWSETGGSEKLQREKETDRSQVTVPSNSEVKYWGKNAPGENKRGGKRNTVCWQKNFVLVLIKGVLKLRRRLSGSRGVRALTRQLCRVMLIRFDRGRPPENLFRRIKQKDISVPVHSLMEFM